MTSIFSVTRLNRCSLKLIASSHLSHIHCDTWRIIEVIPGIRSLLTDNPPNPGKVGHTKGVWVPYSFQTVVGSFMSHKYQISESAVRQGPTVFYSSNGTRDLDLGNKIAFLPKARPAFPFFPDYPLWTTLIPCNRQKTYLQLPHWYLGPVYKERGLPLCKGYPSKHVKVSSGLQVNYFTSFTDAFRSDIG